MLALRYHALRDVRLDDVPEPEPGPGEVKVRVALAGICGSDIHEYRSGPIAVPVADAHPLTGERAPITLGHEFVGTVVAVGDEVTDVAVGQRVSPSAVLACGRCDACSRGHAQLCASLGFHGLSGGGGGFAAFDTFPASIAHVVPDAVPDRVGALLEPLATGVHGVARAGIGEGATVLVAGAGPIGLTTVVAARAAGADRVIVSEPSPARAATARRLGATTVLDPTTTDVDAAVRDLTGGLGVDAAFDAAGLTTSFATALGALRARGTLVNLAVWEQPTSLWPTALLFTEATITGALAYTAQEFETAIAIAASGEHDLEALVSREIPLAGAADGFARLADSPGDDVKVLVRP